MKSRPILFSGPMVRALLNGSKTQTRRAVKPQGAILTDAIARGLGVQPPKTENFPVIECPFGKSGDQLWVRENGWEAPDLSPRDLREGADTWPAYEYDAEPLMCWDDGELKKLGWKRRPSIHMPRWASRITLQVTGVRVERLQDIGEVDAIAEGIERFSSQRIMWRDYSKPINAAGGYWFAESSPVMAPVLSYKTLWESINGPHSWVANPWVWVVEFRRVVN